MARTSAALDKSPQWSWGPVLRAHPWVTNVGPFDDAIIRDCILNATVASFPPFSDLWNAVSIKHAVQLALEAAFASEMGMSKLEVKGTNDRVPLLP